MSRFNDYVSSEKIRINEKNLEKQIISFFEKGSKLIFPAKSYFVAIVYAKCLEEYFGVNFYEALDDKDLLLGDKYFIPYSKSKNIYDFVLKEVGDIWNYKSVEITVKYFKQEFLVEESVN